MIYIKNKRKSKKTLQNLYPNAKIIDVTSKSITEHVKLSPFYPHGNIPIPFSKEYVSESVEGIWQGLKVFEKYNIDEVSFKNNKMRNIKRTARKFGMPLGHRKGVNGNILLSYIEARWKIYLPSYLWVLNNKVQNIIQELNLELKHTDIILLDYEINCDISNSKKPLSHAFLIKSYLENSYPTQEYEPEQTDICNYSGIK